jgi:peptidase E
MGLLRRLVRTGLRKGLVEGSRGWLYTGVSAGALVVARRVLASRPEVVYRAELRPGDGLEVRAIPPKS